MIYKILDLFFPPTCGLCGKIGKHWICGTCYRKIKPFIKLKRVQVKKNLFVNYMFLYGGDLRDLLLSFKFNENSYLFRLFVEIICRDKKVSEIIKKSDFIIPVPMYKDTKKRRGYNQTELICEGISKRKDILYDNSILIQIKNNKTQSLLNRFERNQNIKNVYDIKNIDRIKNRNIILFDDICTTGATINDCYKILNRYAKEVTVLVLAKSNYKKG